MRAKRGVLPLILRLDWAIYLTLVVGFMWVLAMELSATVSAGEAPGGSQGGGSGTLPEGGIGPGVVYALLVWLVIPGVVFVVANVRESRRFSRMLAERYAREAAIPMVRVKAPVVVGVERSADESARGR